MYILFSNKQEFNYDISQWDVSNVKNMQSMFEGARTFYEDISQWTTNPSVIFILFINSSSPLAANIQFLPSALQSQFNPFPSWWV